MIDRSVLLGYTTLLQCPECKYRNALETELDKLVYYQKRFHHIDCLKKFLSKKIDGRTKKPIPDEKIDQLIAGLREETEKHAFSLMVKNHLKKHLVSHYKLIDLSVYDYSKLENIFSGKHRNMSCGIPPEHIIDMLQRKQKEYDRIIRSKKLDPSCRVAYLLGMIVNDYPSYVDYMEKRRVERERHAAEAKEQKIDMTRFVKPKKTQQDILEEDEDY